MKLNRHGKTRIVRLPPSPTEGAFFQAVGIIQGDVTSDGDKTFVTIGEKSYGLYYASTHKMAYEALKKEIEKTGITQQKLIVYPRITHYPGGKQPYRLAFQLAGFRQPEPFSSTSIMISKNNFLSYFRMTARIQVLRLEKVNTPGNLLS